MQSRLFTLTLFIVSRFCSSNAYNKNLRDYDRKVCANEPSCHLLNETYIPTNRLSLERRDCMCDAACVEYRDCCSDSWYYNEEEQSRSQRYHCPSSDKVYMQVSCPTTWSDETVTKKCAQFLEPLADTDFSLCVPVTNPIRNITYGNKYCAICNEDTEYKSWTAIPLCGEVKKEYISKEGTLRTGIRLSIDYGKYRGRAHQIWETVTYDQNLGYFFSRYNDTLFVCRMHHVLPRELETNVRHCIPNLIETCSNQTNDELVKKCRSRTSIVFQIKDTRKRYRNINCAECNDVSESQVNGCPIKLKEH